MENKELAEIISQHFLGLIVPVIERASVQLAKELSIGIKDKIVAATSDVNLDECKITLVPANHQLPTSHTYFHPVGVNILHIPTNKSVSCGLHRSEHKNKAAALHALSILLAGNNR